MELMRQQDMPSLSRNGNFQAGLAYWLFTSGVIHDVSEVDSSGTPALFGAPKYLANIPAEGKIQQIISRSDVYTYPSRRWVEDVTAIPIGINTLGALSTTGQIDGRAPSDDDNFFELQELDQFGELVEAIPMRKGLQVEVVDAHRRSTQSGPYRVGRLAESTNPLLGKYLHLSPIDNQIIRLATEEDYNGATYTTSVGAGGQVTATVTITGKHAFDRQEEGIYSGVGIKVLDCIVMVQPDFAVGRVVSVQETASGYTLQLAPAIPGVAFFPTGSAIPMEEWFISPITELSMIRELPVFAYDFTLAFSYDSDIDYVGQPKLDIVDRGFKVIRTIPAVLLENNALFEDLTLSEQLLQSRYRRRLYRFFLEASKPVTGLLRLTIPGGTNGAKIGDVVLHKGNFTRRHDYDDRDDPSISVVADSRSSLDRLYGGVDHCGGVLPRGVVVLYAGGPVCPPGYKRVESLPNSPTDGYRDPIPFPNVVSYDEERNRTILVWDDQTFDLLDSRGRTIPIKGEAQTIQVALPPQSPFNGALEQLQIGPVHQWIQPGMSIRVRTSDRDTTTNKLFNYSVPIRAAFVDRSEVAGAYENEDPTFSNTYPLYINGANLDQEEVAFQQFGPDKTQQPTVYSQFTPTPQFVSPSGLAAINPGSFSGLQSGSATMTITGVQAGPLLAGEVVYVRWQTSTVNNPLSGGFIARIVDHTNQTVVVERYDGNGMVVSGTTAQVSGSAYFTDAKLFDSQVIVTRTAVANEIVFSARRFTGSFIMTVFGDCTYDLNNFNDEIRIEPSGFVRYGEPGFDYGGMGHSHEVQRGDATFNQNLAPHVNSNYESLPPTVVARKHGHGYFPKYVFPIPQFRAYLLCERL